MKRDTKKLLQYMYESIGTYENVKSKAVCFLKNITLTRLTV